MAGSKATNAKAREGIGRARAERKAKGFGDKTTDEKVFIELMGRGLHASVAAEGARLDREEVVTKEAYRQRALVLMSKPYVRHAIMMRRTKDGVGDLVQKVWKRAIIKTSDILHDPRATNQDVIAASVVAGRAAGAFVEKHEVVLEHRIEFRSLAPRLSDEDFARVALASGAAAFARARDDDGMLLPARAESLVGHDTIGPAASGQDARLPVVVPLNDVAQKQQRPVPGSYAPDA